MFSLTPTAEIYWKDPTLATVHCAYLHMLQYQGMDLLQISQRVELSSKRFAYEAKMLLSVLCQL